jgi:hypothetical protein
MSVQLVEPLQDQSVLCFLTILKVAIQFHATLSKLVIRNAAYIYIYVYIYIYIIKYALYSVIPSTRALNMFRKSTYNK